LIGIILPILWSPLAPCVDLYSHAHPDECGRTHLSRFQPPRSFLWDYPARRGRPSLISKPFWQTDRKSARHTRRARRQRTWHNSPVETLKQGDDTLRAHNCAAFLPVVGVVSCQRHHALAALITTGFDQASAGKHQAVRGRDTRVRLALLNRSDGGGRRPKLRTEPQTADVGRWGSH